MESRQLYILNRLLIATPCPVRIFCNATSISRHCHMHQSKVNFVSAIIRNRLTRCIWKPRHKDNDTCRQVVRACSYRSPYTHDACPSMSTLAPTDQPINTTREKTAHIYQRWTRPKGPKTSCISLNFIGTWRTWLNNHIICA